MVLLERWTLFIELFKKFQPERDGHCFIEQRRREKQSVARYKLPDLEVLRICLFL